ncbi:MAG: type II toxin-antitoxin system VapC family toxin [Acidobacteria bacterium]|nr:type II toxin-antitoxin system VapC family toxin [Acidobacteriota bacterium]
MAYFLLGTEPFVDEVRQFWYAVREPMAPALWEAELANVVWMAIRSGVVPPGEGLKRLDLAARLGVHSVTTRKLWYGAVSRAVQSGLAVYDTLFVELASRERLPLVSFDAKVLTAFPEIAKRPGVLLAK